jgi:hypothetical protein
MADFKTYLVKTTLSFQGSEEEKLCGEILFSDNDIHMGDKRLNNVAAYTYNATTCTKLFVMIEKALSPTDNPWKTIYKSILLLHTIVLFGSELAIDKAIQLCRFVHPLGTYNSALAKKGFFSSGGTDYGAPVRAAAKTLDEILINDENIRKARSDARAGQDSLVPMGELLGGDDVTASHNRDFNPAHGSAMNYGQGITTSVGAGFGLHAVPGIYEGRPERYFDADSDRKHLLVPTGTKDSQLTRDVSYRYLGSRLLCRSRALNKGTFCFVYHCVGASAQSSRHGVRQRGQQRELAAACGLPARARKAEGARGPGAEAAGERLADAAAAVR